MYRIVIESYPYYYDAVNRLTNEDRGGAGVRYAYDLLNRQIHVKTLDGREQENLYDGEGLRAGLTENGKRTTFLFYNGEIQTESAVESGPFKRYLTGRGLSHLQTGMGHTMPSTRTNRGALRTSQGRR